VFWCIVHAVRDGVMTYEVPKRLFITPHQEQGGAGKISTRRGVVALPRAEHTAKFEAIDTTQRKSIAG
jgi:hypothetical protein